MIIIFSDRNDFVTNTVMENLINRGEEVIRINDGTSVGYHFSNVQHTAPFLEVNNRQINIDEIKSIWIRKLSYFSKLSSNDNNVFIDEFLKREMTHFVEYLELLLKDKFKLSAPMLIKFNKLEFIHYAAQFNVKIPDSFIISKKERLKSILKKYPRLITKPISNIINPKSQISMLTKLVDESSLENLPEEFFPSLFQECIKTIFEVRSVFINKAFYSAYLIPHYKSKREPDFRGSKNLDLGLTAFELPKEIAENIMALLNHLTIEFCSIDLLVNEKNEYFLTDINPFGQFGMVSNIMENNIESMIADALVE